MRRSLLKIVWLAAFLWPLPATAQVTYSAKEIHGRIVEAETGEPLQGVNIVAQWKIDRALVGDDKALLHVTETVTDKDGNYSFPAWGPIPLPLRADFGQGRDPRLSIFKSGYAPEYLDNGIISDIRYRLTPLGEFKGNGTTIKLKRWTGGLEEYGRKVEFLANDLPSYTAQWRDPKEWRNFSKMLIALNGEYVRLKNLGGKTFSLPGVFRIDQFEQEDQILLKGIGR